jgi:hypothetical protein
MANFEFKEFVENKTNYMNNKWGLVYPSYIITYGDNVIRVLCGRHIRRQDNIVYVDVLGKPRKNRRRIKGSKLGELPTLEPPTSKLVIKRLIKIITPVRILEDSLANIDIVLLLREYI